MVREQTGTGQSRCCSHQDGHSSTKAGNPLLLQNKNAQEMQEMGGGGDVLAVRLENITLKILKSGIYFPCMKSMVCGNQVRIS